MSDLYILGAGGHGAVVAEAAVASGQWRTIGFLDQDPASETVVGLQVFGDLDTLAGLADEETEVFVAVGDNRRRLELYDDLADRGFRIATIIHPQACVSSSAEIGVGTVVCAGTVVNARTRIDRGCILNTGSTVDHDCVLHGGVHVSPGANIAGGVSVGGCSWIGVGSAIREGVSIGEDVIVGAGAAVIGDVESGAKVGGVPARRLGPE